jgi:DNA mismatch repair protein MLH1
LALAATRHATSKFTSFQDFAGLQTFGFRGEALASVSMVSRLTVTSRTPESSVAFSQTYRNGTPTSQEPKPCARKPGTTILVQDLFYNVLHRLKTYSKRESDEYSKILDVVQSYAIHYPHAGFVCQRTRSGANKTVLVDVNTSQLKHVQALIKSKDSSNKEAFNNATKEVMSHVFESNLEPHLSHFECSETGKKASDFSCECQAYFTSPAFDAKSTKFVLFLNDRLVDLPVLKRSLEDVYADFSKTRPILVVKVTVPGTQVDVNVHPSKRQVALMYQDELCSLICSKLREALQEYGQSFKVQSVAPVANPYARKRKLAEGPRDENKDKQTHKPVAKKKTPPSQLVRTSGATPVGAIEPFLVSTQPSSSQTQLSQGSITSDNPSTPSQKDNVTHITDCPISSQSMSIDMSQPGAFAGALRCNCPPDEARRQVLVKKIAVRPKRVIPTKTSYTSIASLRKRVNKQASTELAKQFRDAYFVGVVSHQRSLVQCGEQLVMINHLELAKELFYQLALARFGGAVMAQLGDGGSGGVNVQTVIAQALQLEDDLILSEGREGEESLQTQQGLLTVSETNENLAQQATACLLDNAGMLEEYFMIRIEKQNENTILTGLPVLLDGHSPESHGLAIFLLRLATQVDWAEERPCFQGVSQELGNYYAMLPSEDVEAYVKHTLFPAISYLLLPSEPIKTDGNFTVMTKLSTLYKVFERC